jgi:hypothetical protein
MTLADRLRKRRRARRKLARHWLCTIVETDTTITITSRCGRYISRTLKVAVPLDLIRGMAQPAYRTPPKA